ncbi:hypothetical protein [Psychrobacillus vulpis]|uniref:Uncharacterized protein n=1 Tax=Psychrobacillus vulpis TaxID=2325572 RepID=A0A544TR84_9BACI|nr:hypothetical protein [Psychrobacillus vulpis]TQR19931.1 hypothetical protein FG384_09720 [Psychrobacillus vulpis]
MALFDKIVEVFNENNNIWMTTRDIYELIDKNIFGENKNGPQGHINMISRDLSQRYSELFEVNENYKPKRYRLATTDKDVIKLNKKYLVNDIKLFIGDKVYEEIAFELENEYEDFVKKAYKNIFGENTIYYDVKKKLGRRICDGLLYDYELDRVIIVENELAKHDLWGHIIPQISGFLIELNNEEVRNKLKYNVNWGEYELQIIKAIDNYKFDIIVVIDRITFNIREEERRINKYMQQIKSGSNSKIFFKEFRVFLSEDNHMVYHVE